MKKFLIISYILVISTTFYSCDKALDINEDPLSATEANPNAVLPFVFTEYTARKTTELGTRTVDVYHHYSATFNSPRNGNTSSFLTGNTWQTWFTNLLGNLQLIEQDAIAGGPLNNNVQAIAKIMKGHLFFELTSIWEEVPFTQALDGVNFPTPQFDSQEVVLDGVVTLMDEAIALLRSGEGSFNFAQGDILLGGNESRWLEFANSIKIRTLMLIRNVPERETEAEAALVAAFNDSIVSQPVFLQYEGTSTSTNAYFDIIQQFDGPTNEAATNVFRFAPSPSIINQLVDTGDPRLEQWIVDPTGTNTYPASDYTTFASPGTESLFADILLRADYPDIYFLPSELSLYKAELLLDGVAIPGGQTAQQAFEEGVTYAVNYWGGNGGAVNTIDGYAGVAVTDTQVSAFIARLGAVTLEKVQTQLWLESFLRPVLAWNTVRRTGVPDLDPPGAATIDKILQRFSYPPDEVAANPNVPTAKPNDEPMWAFAQNQD